MGNKNSLELATVTSTGDSLNAQGIGEYRGIKIIGQPGILSIPQQGEDVQLAKNWGMGSTAAAIGVVQDTKGIEPGEVKIFSTGGAEIHLKNNGDIIFNGGFTVYADGSTSSTGPRVGG